MRSSILWPVLAALTMPAACAEEPTTYCCGEWVAGDGFCVCQVPTLTVSAGGKTLGPLSTLTVNLDGDGEQLATTFVLSNTGDAPLRVDTMTVATTGGTARLAFPQHEGVALPRTLEAEHTSEAPKTLVAELWVDRVGDEPVVVSVEIASNAKTENGTAAGDLRFEVVATNLTPNAAVAPSGHVYGAVTLGDRATRTVHVLNTGDDDLRLMALELEGDAGFGTFLEGSEWWGTPPGPSTYGLDKPLLIAPGTSRPIPVWFAPEAAGAAEGTLRFITDAPHSEAEVALQGEGVATSP